MHPSQPNPSCDVPGHPGCKAFERRRIAGRTKPALEILDPRFLMAADLPAGPLAAVAAAEVGPALESRVDQMVSRIMATDHIPGMGVAVTYRGRVVLEKGYGVADASTGTPVSADTPFGIGSVTKTFTAMAVLTILDDPSLITKPGITHLNLDQPIGSYLSDTAEFQLPPSWASLTTRELLVMSGGMPNAGDGRPWYDQVEEVGRRGLLFPPGSAYLYSNAGYWALGALVQQLTGTVYGQFIQERITGPLGMDDTVVLADPATSVPGQAVGYKAYDPTTQRWTLPDSYSSGESAFSAGAIVSTARDLGTYMSALWARKLLKPSTYTIMWSPVPLPSFQDPPNVATPGMGWSDGNGVVVTPEGIIINKDGGVPGFSAQVTMNFGNGFGVAFAYNLSRIGESHPNPRDASIIQTIFEAITTAGIEGTVYQDRDGSGSVTPADPRLAGWQVFIDANENGRYDVGEASTTTNAEGQYLFGEVPPGRATVRVAPPRGWWPVSPTSGALTRDLGPSDLLTAVDFGFSRLADVTQVTRTGRGRRTRIVLTFTEPLAPAGASDRQNYAIVAPGRNRGAGIRVNLLVPVTSASYDASTRSVALATKAPSLLNRRLLIRALGPGIKNTAGLALDGDDDGRPGGDFVMSLCPRRVPPRLLQKYAIKQRAA